MNARVFLALVVLFLAISVGAAAGGQDETEVGSVDDGLRVFVSIQPQKYFVERIAPEADVSVMVPPGKEPHSYEPTPRQMSGLSAADVYFRIGVPFEEAFIPRIERSLENLMIVETTRSIERRHLTVHDHGDEHHEEGDDHAEEGGLDPHVWLGPMEVKSMAAEMRDALVELRPDRAESYRENYRAFAAEIDELHNTLSDELAPYAGETMFVFHPAFGYFADAYGLEQEAVETGGNEPSAAQLERIIEQAQADGVEVIFVQPQFSRDSAERVAQAIDGVVVPIDPLAEDWMANMRAIAERVQEGLE